MISLYSLLAIPQNGYALRDTTRYRDIARLLRKDTDGRGQADQRFLRVNGMEIRMEETEMTMKYLDPVVTRLVGPGQSRQ